MKNTADQSPEAQVVRLLSEHHLTFAAAESCTGGLITHRLTNVAGSSTCIMGAIVAYSYGAKEKFLGVSHDTLVQHGAVSEETAAEMVRGVRSAFGVDLAVSVTGIAGPGGGMPNKPVGLTYIGFSAPGIEHVSRHVWTSDREGNKQASAQFVYAMLLDYLHKHLKEEAR